MSKVTYNAVSYVKEVLAAVTGNSDEALAIKNARKQVSYYEVQIAAMAGKRITLEDNLETAKTHLKNTALSLRVDADGKTTIMPIASSDAFLSAMENAEDMVEAAQEALEALDEKVAKYKKALAALVD